MTNWKTTTSAVATAACGFILFSPELFAQWPWIVAVAKYAMAGGLIAFGVSARDASASDAAHNIDEMKIHTLAVEVGGVKKDMENVIITQEKQK